MHTPLTEDDLSQFCARMGLPALTRCRAVGPPGPTQDHRLEFEGDVPSLGLRVEVHPRSEDGLSAEVAALTELGRQMWPVSDRCQIVQVGGFRASLRSVSDGQTGAEWLSRQPESAPWLASQLGLWLGRLSQIRQARPGWTAIGNRFVGRHSTWVAMWEERVHRLKSLVRFHGLGAPIVDRSLDALIAATSAMKHVMEIGIVHTDFHPGQLRLQASKEGPRVVGIEGWHRAISGDPLLSWATTFVADDRSLRGVVEGDSDGHLHLLLSDPGGPERLDAYVRMRWMWTLVNTMEPWYRHHRTQSSLERCLALQGLEDCFASPPHQRVQGDGSLPAVQAPSVSRVAVLEMGLLQSLERGRVTPGWGWTWCSAVSAVELGGAAGPDSAWFGEADRLVACLDDWVEPVPARQGQAASISDVVERALRLSRTPTGGHRLPVVFVASAMRLWGGAPEALPGTVVWRLSCVVEQLGGLDPGWRSSEPPPLGARLAHALMGLAAVHQLSAVLGDDAPEILAVRTQCADQAERAWTEASGTGLVGEVGLGRLRFGPPPVGASGQSALSASLCAALLWLSDAGRIPVSAEECARVLGLVAPARP